MGRICAGTVGLSGPANLSNGVRTGLSDSSACRQLDASCLGARQTGVKTPV
jgi:hypothetical protein